MKLIDLEVKNFATYKDQKWNFTKASSPVFVSGDTGSGKTTFFIDAVTSALYGRAYGEMRPGSVKETISSGASQAIVKLSFEVGGERYILARIFYLRGTSKAQLRKVSDSEDTVISSSTKEVDSKVLDLIRMEYKAFLNTVVIRQGEVASIISKNLDPAERRQIFLDAFNIEFQKHQETAKTARQKRQNDLANLDGQIEQLQEQMKIKPEIEETKRKTEDAVKALSVETEEEEKKLTSILKRVKHLEAESARLNKEVARKKGRIEELETNREKLKNLKTEALDLQSRVEDVNEAKLEKISVLTAQMVKLLEQEERLKELKNELKEVEIIVKEKEELEEKVKSLAQVPEELRACEKELKDTQRKMHRTNRSLNENLAILSRLKNEEELLQTSGEACPVCRSKITSSRKEEIQKHIDEEKKSLEKSRGREEKVVKNLEEKAAELDESIKILLEKSRELSNIEGQIGRLKTYPAKKRSLQKRIVDLQADFDKARNEIESFTELPYKESMAYIQRVSGDAKDYFRAKERLEVLNELTVKMSEEIDLLTQEVGGIEHGVKELERVEAERRELEDEGEIVRRRLDELKSELNSDRGALETYRMQLNNLNQMERLIEEKKVEREECEIDRKAYEVLETKIFHDRGVPSLLLRDYVERIEIHARRYLGHFMPDKDIRLDVTEKQLSIKVLDGGVERGLETYSGGESVIVGFAIRLAIGRTLTEALTWERPRFLMIDEGFGPLDDNLRMAVVEALRSLQNEYEQIYVISHMMDIKSHPLFQTLVEVEKVDGESGLKIVRSPILV